MQLNKYNT